MNAKNTEKATPLHLAARLPSISIVELLLSKGADATIKDSDDNTPMKLAILLKAQCNGGKRKEYTKMIELLNVYEVKNL